MNDIQQKAAEKHFSELWKGKGYEMGESQKFWLLHIPLHQYRKFTRMIPPIHTMIPAVHRWILLSGRRP